MTKLELPDDETLKARGTYSTLGRERKKQIERFQKAAQTAMHSLAAALKEVSDMPPGNSDAISTVEKCLQNMMEARGEVVALSGRMIAIKEQAWP